jgi:hypothetical protein
MNKNDVNKFSRELVDFLRTEEMSVSEIFDYFQYDVEHKKLATIIDTLVSDKSIVKCDKSGENLYTSKYDAMPIKQYYAKDDSFCDYRKPEIIVPKRDALVEALYGKSI